MDNVVKLPTFKNTVADDVIEIAADLHAMTKSGEATDLMAIVRKPDGGWHVFASRGESCIERIGALEILKTKMIENDFGE